MTVKVVGEPTIGYVWEGFWRLLVDPSPKVQFQLVGLLAEVSVKLTSKGPYPLVVLLEKPATGGGSVIEI